MTLLRTARERTIALVLGGTVGLFGLVQLGETFVFAPLAARRLELSGLERQLQDLDFQSALVRRAQSHIAAQAESGLAADPVTATLDCQNWLLDTARRAQLQAVHIVPGRPVAEEGVGYRIPFTLSATGRFLSVVQLLERTQGFPGLMRLSHIEVAAAGGTEGKGDELTISVMLEVIALRDGGSASVLSPLKTLENGGTRQRLKQLAAGPTLFGRPTRTESVARTAPAIDEQPAAATAKVDRGYLLIACGRKDAQPLAWFMEPDGETLRTFQAGESFTHESRTLTVRRIESDQVVLTRDGRDVLVELGQALPGTEPR